MRFVLAMICFVVAAAMMGTGAAQRTFLAGPSEVTAATTETTSTPVVVLDGAALNAYEQSQNVEISGAPTIFAAYGRTDDVLAWVGDASYTHITYDAESGTLVSDVTSGAETEVPSPAGSDLWLREYMDEGSLNFRVAVPDDISFIVVSDGVEPAPSTVAVTWPLDNSTPWSGPIIAAGAMVLLLGLLLLLWALTHMRRTRGPRRTAIKQPKMPKLPRQRTYKPSRPKALEPQRGRRATRRFVALAPAMALALVMAGCSTGASNLAAETPSAKDTADPTEIGEAIAATEAQALRVIANVSSVAAQADSELDQELIASRFAGPALEVRLANYQARAADSSVAPVRPVPSGPVEVILPGLSDSWPRVMFAAINPAIPEDEPAEGEEGEADAEAESDAERPVPLGMMFVQEDPRSNFKLHYLVVLNNTLPPVAPKHIGASRIAPDLGLLQMRPDALAAAYGDVLIKEAESEWVDFFEEEGDGLRPQVGIEARKAEIAALPATAKISYSYEVGSGQTIGLSTNDAGSIVVVQLNEIKTVTPVATGAVVNPSGAVKAITGKDMSTKGFRAVYGDQLLFFVPREGEPGKIVLLGFSQALISAKEIE